MSAMWIFKMPLGIYRDILGQGICYGLVLLCKRIRLEEACDWYECQHLFVFVWDMDSETGHHIWLLVRVILTYVIEMKKKKAYTQNHNCQKEIASIKKKDIFAKR